MKFYIAIRKPIPLPLYEIERPQYYCGWPVCSLIFTCPYCCDQWAEIVSEQRLASPSTYPMQLQPSSCERCPPWTDIFNHTPGSLLDNHSFSNGPDYDLLNALPEALLRREAQLHFAQLDRYLSNEPSTVKSPAGQFSTFTIEQLIAIRDAWCQRAITAPRS